MSNILFITEGTIDEPEFLKKMIKVCYRNKNYNIYSYNTTIHTLIQKLFIDGKIDEDIDIRLALRENEQDEEKRKILSKKYTEIFLMFDFEPQHNKLMFKEIEQMLEILNDSTDKGKLYINYPMMQSYKHINKMPDNKFKNKKVNLKEILKYKQIVGEETYYQDIKKYNYPILVSMMLHHLKKINYILNGKYEILDKKEFLNIDFSKLYKTQLNMFKNKQEIFVVNTAILNILDYNPSKILNQVASQKEKFYI